MTITHSHLTRAAGVSAVAAGLLYIVIQPIHPTETVSAVSGGRWALVGCLTIAMAVLGLVGVSGIYLRQVTESGLLGLIGYLMFGSFYVLTTAFTFAETVILPPLAENAPGFVDSFLGIFSGDGVAMDLGALEMTAPVAAVLYLGGGSLFGLAVFRADVLDRRAALLLVVGALAALLVPLLPHDAARYAAIPVGLAMMWLGYSLWSVEGQRIVPDAPIRTARRGGGRVAPREPAS